MLKFADGCFKVITLSHLQVLNEITNIGKSTANVEPIFKPVVVDLSTCSKYVVVSFGCKARYLF